MNFMKKTMTNRLLSLAILIITMQPITQPVFAGNGEKDTLSTFATIRVLFRAPAGTTVTLQNNGAQQLIISTDSTGVKISNFPAIPDGSSYNITIKSAPKGMKFKMERASGTINSIATVNITGDYE